MVSRELTSYEENGGEAPGESLSGRSPNSLQNPYFMTARAGPKGATPQFPQSRRNPFVKIGRRGGNGLVFTESLECVKIRPQSLHQRRGNSLTKLPGNLAFFRVTAWLPQASLRRETENPVVRPPVTILGEISKESRARIVWMPFLGGGRHSRVSGRTPS